MNIEDVRDYCISKRGVEEGFPFDDETLVFKVCEKIFAVIALEKPYGVILKCHPALTEILRSQYNAISPAPYFNKSSWNWVAFNEDVCDKLIVFLIDHAYGETIRGFTKKKQVEFFKEGLAADIFHHHENVCDSTMEKCDAEIGAKYTPLFTTDLQRKGRGQRGNKWESENGKNLLFSFIFHPNKIAAAEQFHISQAIALSLIYAIRNHCPPLPHDIASSFSIKWPNDIYYKDHKVAGILIEHTLEGSQIRYTKVGIGLNVNQEVFRSDAPNPISLKHIFGYELPRFVVLESFIRQWEKYHHLISESKCLHEEYMANLYRRDGFYPFSDREGNFDAAIEEIQGNGCIVLKRKNGEQSVYDFKQLKFIVSPD